MSALNAILLGVLQGILEFLPVSSFGHIAALRNILGLKEGTGAVFEVFVHLGTLAGVIRFYRKDVRRLLEESYGMLMDLVGNGFLFFHNKKYMEQVSYHKILDSSYRRFTALILLSMVPTAIIGLSARGLAQLAAASAIAPGIGMLLNGVFLIVADFSGCGKEQTAKKLGAHAFMWMGIVQGLSVFPGISRCGLTTGTGMFCGYNQKLAVRISCLMAIPAILGAFLVEIFSAIKNGLSDPVPLCILGALAAALTGCLLAEALLKLLQKAKFRYFAIYCFIAGAFFLWGSAR